MAISKGTESKSNFVEWKRYIGIGNVNVKAINPNKAELKKFGIEVDEEPTYVTEKNGVLMARIALYTSPIEFPNEIIPINFFIRNIRFTSISKGTFQVIDSYGRTAWVTEEQMETHAIPQYSNGMKASLSANYRAAYSGEDNFTQFVKMYLGIPNLTVYNNGQWIANPKVQPADCEVRFDHIDRWFKGDFSEIKEAFAFRPNNVIQMLFGVRNNDENKQYQSYFSDKFAFGCTPDHLKYKIDFFKKEIDKIKNNSATSSRYADTEFEFVPLKEYEMKPADFKEIPDDEAVFDDEKGDNNKNDEDWDLPF